MVGFFEKKIKISYLLSVLVLMIHASTIVNYPGASEWVRVFSIFFQRVITPVAVPLFFVISGAMYFRDYEPQKYVSKTKKRVMTLMVPFLLWNTINMLFNIVATLWFSEYFIGRIPFEFTPWSFFVSIFHYEHNLPFWFVFALIIFSLCAPVFDLLLRRIWIGVGVIVALAVLAGFGIGIPEPFFFDRTSIVYYMTGALIGRYFFKWFSTKHSVKQSIFAVAMVVLSWIYWFLINYDMIPHYLGVDVVVLLMFCYGVWVGIDLVVDRITKRRHMEHSFWVYAMHNNCGSVVTKLLFFVLPKTDVFVVVNYICTIAITLVMIEVICRVIMRVSPTVAVALSGGRDH